VRLLKPKREDFMKPSTAVHPLALTLILSACASMQTSSAPVKMNNDMLTGNDGMTLYVFDKDSAGKSVCNGPCATNWPPLMAADGASNAGDYSVLVRDDGKKQWAYKSRPLYAWSKDQKPGDKTGDGFLNNLWHVAKP
jgi:predicted lipoprotein with Yx(FWY)xxD motif